MYFKPEKDKKSESIKLLNKVFDIGTVGFKFLFDSKLGKFDLKLFESKDGYLKFVFTPEFVEIIHHDGKEKNQITKKDFEPKIKIGAW